MITQLDTKFSVVATPTGYTYTYAWLNANPVTVPDGQARYGALAFDSVRDKMVLWAMLPDKTDIWEYNGTNWVGRTVSCGIQDAAFMTVACAFDRLRGELVLFLHIFDGSDTRQTWTFNGTAWTNKAPATQPPAGGGDGQMVWDDDNGYCLFIASTSPMQTWSWNGTTWTRRFPAATPPDRTETALAFDYNRGEVVLWGGYGGATVLADTWTWDGTNWMLKSPATSPPGSYGHQMGFDRAFGKVIMRSVTSPVRTWLWDGTTWTEATPVSPNLSVRNYAHFAYDENVGKLMCWSGTDIGGAQIYDTRFFDVVATPI